jgi:hypothetical protein
VLEEDAVDRESRETAAAVFALRLEQLREAGVAEIGAQLVVVGREGRVSARATVPVIVVPA